MTDQTPDAVASRLPHIASQHTRLLRRIQSIEQRMISSATAKRRRAANLLDETPTHRRSHLRLFLTHHHHSEEDRLGVPGEKTNKRRNWTLVIEGKLLVGHLDHKSAERVEREASLAAAASGSCGQGNGTDASAASVDTIPGGERIQSSTSALRPMNPGVVGVGGAAEIPPSLHPSVANLMTRSTDKTGYRGVSEKEGDGPVEAILFTHFFDRILCRFQTIRKKKVPNKEHDGMMEDVTEAAATTPKKQSGGSSRSKRQQKKESQRAAAAAASAAIASTESRDVNSARDNDGRRQTFVTSGTTQLCWYREPSKWPPSATQQQEETEDAHAFHALYADDADETDEEHYVVATVELYRRPGGEDRYKPSKELAMALFPAYWNMESEGGERKGKKKKVTEVTPGGAAGGGNKKRKRRSSDVSAGSETSDPQKQQMDDGGDANGNLGPPSLENDIVVPETLTMKEVVSAIFLYAKDRNLQDQSDLSIVNNDEILNNLFGCERMLFSAVRGLLLSRGLLMKVVPGKNDEPIQLTYVMTSDAATPLDASPSLGTGAGMVLGGGSAATTTTTTARQPEAATTPAKRRRGGDREQISEKSKPVLPDIQPSVLSLDVDIEVPGLYHDRTRELLRRVKRREFEYTSSRTKALKMLLAAKADEDAVKSKIEDVVSGRSLSSDHVPVLLALAKAAPPGSEARNAAHVDARMTLLVERIQHHARMAKACWEIVDACRGGSSK